VRAAAAAALHGAALQLKLGHPILSMMLISSVKAICCCPACSVGADAASALREAARRLAELRHPFPHFTPLKSTLRVAQSLALHHSVTRLFCLLLHHLWCCVFVHSVRAEAASALREAARRLAEAEAQSSQLRGDLADLQQELDGRPTQQEHRCGCRFCARPGDKAVVALFSWQLRDDLANLQQELKGRPAQQEHRCG
jgi:hypothetical protein